MYQSEVSKETRNTFSVLNTGDLIQGRGYTDDERHEKQSRVWWSRQRGVQVHRVLWDGNELQEQRPLWVGRPRGSTGPTSRPVC